MSFAKPPISGSPATDAPPTDTTIDQDTPCIGCDYNLRGLRPASTCPECGLDIEHSLHGDFIVNGEAERLRRMGMGILLMILATPAGILVAVLVELVRSDVETAIGVGLAVTPALSAIGALRLTSAANETAGVTRGTGWRLALRYCASATLGAIPIYAGVIVAAGLTSSLGEISAIWLCTLL